MIRSISSRPFPAILPGERVKAGQTALAQDALPSLFAATIIANASNDPECP